MNQYEKRFEELLLDMDKIEKSKLQKHGEMVGDYFVVNEEELSKWKLKLKSLFLNLCGNTSEYYKELIVAAKYDSYQSFNDFMHVKPVFMALYEDYKNGYLESLKSVIAADLFADQLDQAKELYDNKYYQAAAIIAGIVLETKLREKCLSLNISIGKLDKNNAELAKAGIYSGIVQKQITALAAIRNSAAHGNVSEYTNEDVKLMISQVLHILGQF
jgi:hypothetical protein